jgi:DNA-binding transcriptional ArsR family regulator
MEINAAVTSLAALAHPARLGVFRLLVVRGPSGALAGEIAREIGMSPTAASFHLRELDHAGLVHATRQGRNIRYALHVDGVRQLLTFLTEDCCRGQPDLCGATLAQPVPTCCPDPACPDPASAGDSGEHPSKPERKRRKP